MAGSCGPALARLVGGAGGLASTNACLERPVPPGEAETPAAASRLLCPPKSPYGRAASGRGRTGDVRIRTRAEADPGLWSRPGRGRSGPAGTVRHLYAAG